MERELQRILFSIKEKMGIDIVATSINGEFEVSTINDFVELNFNKNAKTDKELKVLKEDKKTYFSFNFNGVKFVGALLGDSLEYLNYSLLIGSYIENNQTKSSYLTFDEQLLSMITGQTTKVKSSNFIDKYSILPFPCYIILFKIKNNKASEICDFLNSYGLESGDITLQIDDNSCVFIRFINPKIKDEFNSPYEYAEYVLRSIYEELGIEAKAFLGGVVNSFYDISLSYKQASEVEELASLTNNDSPINSYKDFVLNKILQDLPNFKLEDYLTVLSENCTQEIFEDTELMETVKEFLNNDLNISETARAMFLHRNTLLYRIEKIQALTGLDIRKFKDALTFKLIETIRKIKK